MSSWTNLFFLIGSKQIPNASPYILCGIPHYTRKSWYNAPHISNYRKISYSFPYTRMLFFNLPEDLPLSSPFSLNRINIFFRERIEPWTWICSILLSRRSTNLITGIIFFSRHDDPQPLLYQEHVGHYSFSKCALHHTIYLPLQETAHHHTSEPQVPSLAR